MDKNGKTLGITGAIVLMSSAVLLVGGAGTGPVEKPEEKTIETHFELVVLNITAYSPDEKQTDDSPYQMASGRIATEEELGEMLFVAVDRKTMEKYGIEFGDTIWIPFLVEDTMHKRITEGVDIFFKDEE